MKSASITYTKNHLSALIEAVKQGQCVIILDRNQPVARLEPLQEIVLGSKNYSSILEKRGVIRCATKENISKILDLPPPKLKKRGSILQALLEERAENR